MHFANNEENQNLNLIAPNLKSLEQQGYNSPTPIQEKVIPIILQCRDLIGCAQMGTGKTAAFAITILQRLAQSLQDCPRYVRTLILTPTCELTIQINGNFAGYSNNLKLKHTAISAWYPRLTRPRALKAGTDTLIATPGRVPT